MGKIIGSIMGWGGNDGSAIRDAAAQQAVRAQVRAWAGP